MDFEVKKRLRFPIKYIDFGTEIPQDAGRFLDHKMFQNMGQTRVNSDCRMYKKGDYFE